MFWSKSNFFKQDVNTLKIMREQVANLLAYKGIVNNLYLEAYDYFVYNPSRFDGATLVKDLDDIKGLDLSALVHDYLYIMELPMYSRKKWLKEKIKADWQYGKSMELLGKGIITPYLRAIALIISTPFYWLIVKFTKRDNDGRSV